MNEFKKKLRKIQEASVEVIYDNTLYDDAPLQRFVEPIRQKLELIRLQKLKRIQDVQEKDDHLRANELQKAEDQRGLNCSASTNVGVILTEKVQRNCQFEDIENICMKARNNISSTFAEVQGPDAFHVDKQTLKYLIELEHQLGNKLERITEMNRECPRIYREALTSQVCISTYEVFFNDFKDNITENCNVHTINEEIDSFIRDRRSMQYSERIQLVKAYQAHVESRELEIKLAEKLKYINSARIQIEEALGVQSQKSSVPRDITSHSKGGAQ